MTFSSEIRRDVHPPLFPYVIIHRGPAAYEYHLVPKDSPEELKERVSAIAIKRNCPCCLVLGADEGHYYDAEGIFRQVTAIPSGGVLVWIGTIGMIDSDRFLPFLKFDMEWMKEYRKNQPAPGKKRATIHLGLRQPKKEE